MNTTRLIFAWANIPCDQYKNVMYQLMIICNRLHYFFYVFIYLSSVNMFFFSCFVAACGFFRSLRNLLSINSVRINQPNYGSESNNAAPLIELELNYSYSSRKIITLLCIWIHRKLFYKKIKLRTKKKEAEQAAILLARTVQPNTEIG